MAFLVISCFSVCCLFFSLVASTLEFHRFLILEASRIGRPVNLGRVTPIAGTSKNDLKDVCYQTLILWLIIPHSIHWKLVLSYVAFLESATASRRSGSEMTTQHEGQLSMPLKQLLPIPITAQKLS